MDIIEKLLAENSSPYVEQPVGIEEFIQSTDYIGNERDKWIWPSVIEDLKEIFKKETEEEWYYHEVVLDEAIRAGKSELISLATTYLVYLMMNLKNPQNFFGLSPESRPTVMNISLSYDKAADVIYSKIRGKILRCGWFKKYKLEPDPSIKSLLRMPKEVYVIPGSSKDTSAVGYDLFAAVLDEAAWLVETRERDVAEEHYNQLQRRLKNTFPKNWMLFIISSPRYVDDFIERKMEEARTNPRIFARRKPIWQAKPKETYCGVTFSYYPYDDIPIEYKEEFDRDGARALRDLGAIPSLAIEPFFREFWRVEQNVNKERSDPLPLKKEGGGRYLPSSPLEQFSRLPEWFRGSNLEEYFIHIDLAKGLGARADRAGFSLGHYDYRRKKPVIDLITAFIGGPGQEISFEEVRQFIIRLNGERDFKRIRLITLDHYESVDFQQIMRGKGFNIGNLSVAFPEHQTCKSMLYEGNLDYYHHELWFEEMKRCELVKGNKCDHPRNFTLDLFDASSGLCHHLVEIQVRRPRPKDFTGRVVRGAGARRTLPVGPSRTGAYVDVGGYR